MYIKLLIADDDGLIRDSLKILLETTENWTVFTASDGNEALEFCRENKDEPPDIILMDIRMPVCDGVEAARNIKNEFPALKIVMLTTFTDEGYISSAINAGAEGYLLKSTPADGIIEMLRAVGKGAQVFDKNVRLSVKEGIPCDGEGIQCDGGHTEERSSFPELTERENEILSLIASGLSNGEISEKLFLSQGTVRNCVSVILEKLGLRDRTQLAVHYWKNK